MNHPLLAALIIAACLIADIWTDVTSKRDVLTGKWNVNHRRGLLWRIPAFIAATWIYWPSLMLWLWFWCIFDTAMALRTGHWARLGETSTLDKLQRKYRWLQWVKYGMGVLAIILYILL